MAIGPHHFVQELNVNWLFKQGNRESESTYLPASDLPTEVHRDLLENGKIEDPFVDLNELSVRWIADETWTYRTTFKTPSRSQNSNANSVLTFGGLDTFASVYLNGKLILESENMFVEHRVDVSTELQEKSAQENTLEITFASARQKGLELVKGHPEHRCIVHQTEISRGPVRKAQYHWGWDWGPILLTVGPWKPVSLEVYTSRIDDVWVEYELNEDLTRAKGNVLVKTEGPASDVSVSIWKTTAQQDKETLHTEVKDGIAQCDFDIPVESWWPRGYGEQALYIVQATLSYPNAGQTKGVSKRVGFRKVELVQEPDTIGTSFYFRVNNADIFCGGSCWIPADSFLTDPSLYDRYHDWVKLAAEGNQTMIRVWGGGVYEPDAFYDACDDFGVLIWQDFMFACANYPAYPAYLASVETEARQNVCRLRNHPSIVLWAGNNEDYQIVERYGLEYRFTEDKDPQSWLNTDFPARYIYEHLLPNIVREESKGVPYHPSSPFGNGTSTTLKVDPTVGDIHQWNVWHGTMEPYQRLHEMGGRFVSEFGMEAYPHLSTFERCISKEEDRYPGSMAMDFRNKAIGHSRRLISYIAENFRIKYDLPSFTHLSQVMQADALTHAYKSWRRRWGTPQNRKCGGVLVWQLNDCWPTISWAVVDYYLVPKPAYYAIKRCMAPLVVCVQRKFRDWTMRPADELWKRDTSHVDMRSVWGDIEFDVWVASCRTEKLDGRVVVRTVSIRTGQTGSFKKEIGVDIEPNGTTEVIQGCKIDIPGVGDANTPFQPSEADPFVIIAELHIGDEKVAADVSWPDPIKYLDFEGRGIAVSYEDPGCVKVKASWPVKGFVVEEKEGVRLSDNGFDLVPGETKEVHITPRLKDGEELKFRYVGM